MSGKRATELTLATAPRSAVGRSSSLFASFRYAGEGLRWAWTTQRNLRVHGAAAVLVLAAIPLVSLTPVEIALLLGAIVAVTAAELFNTVAEALADLVCPQRHPLAKVIKDVAAAGVLVTAAGAAVVGTVILWPHLRHLF